jgi:undecaprenyl-diphosphatase
MNDYLQALILGIIEGLTEFLPVSSTAHLRIAQDLLHIDLQSDYWKMFAIVIQLGAILAVVVYFRGRIRQFVSTFPWSGGWRKQLAHPVSLVLLSFVVTALPCYLIDKKIGENLESLPIMAWALLIGGVVMWIVDAAMARRARIHRVEEMTPAQAVAIGAAQILSAAFPGTSRSMSTIAAGQLLGLSRPAALEFSFFLSIPVMFAATGFKLVQFVTKSPVAMTGHEWGVLGTGFFVSLLVAWAVIAWFMAWVRKRGFAPFAVYRILLGSGLLIWLATRNAG